MLQYFSQRVQKIFEIYLKDTYKRVKLYQASLNISQRVQKIFDVHIKDTYKRARNRIKSTFILWFASKPVEIIA